MLEKEGWQRLAAKLICVTIALAAIYVTLKYAVGMLLPFLIACCIAFPIGSLSTKSAKKLGGKRRSWAIFYTVIFWSGALLLISLLAKKLSNEAGELIAFLSEHTDDIGDMVTDTVKSILDIPSKLPFINNINVDGISDRVNDITTGIVKSLTQKGSDLLALCVGGMIVGVPKAFMALLACVATSIYIASDGENISGYLCGLLPAGIRKKVKIFDRHLSNGIRGYARAYFLLFIITLITVYLGLIFLHADYAFIIALTVAILDLLPVLNSAIILIPWSMVMFIGKNYSFGVGLIILTLAVTLIKHIAEPRLVGRGLGIHPLASLVSMYVGFRLFGFFGMILAPLFVFLLREMLEDAKKEEKIEEKT